MQFDSEKISDTLMVIYHNEERLDANMAPSFVKYVSSVVDDQVNDLIIVLSEVKFIDSSGLGALVTLLKRLNGRGAVHFVGVNTIVGDLFKLTRLDRLFVEYESVEKAIEKLS
ncbi:hypothetical protein A9Q99_00370 [Gammaproteobacteria bacterium 45_16_T64]|nr:hypothetical protein A9Q99_00370 [Gammaproteobacteria bacterium 45_16_T64]